MTNDWRLPTTLQPDPTCDDQGGGDGYGYNCTGSEIGHLWYVELGNTAGVPMSNTGGFQNLQPSVYWSATEVAQIPDLAAWVFAIHNDNGYGF